MDFPQGDVLTAVKLMGISVLETLKTTGKAAPKVLVDFLVAIIESLEPHSIENEELVSTMLDRLTPGKMRRRLANALMRIANLSAFEGVRLREFEGRLQVFLKQRVDEKDHFMQWHCSGTVMRASEKSFEAVMDRLAADFGIPEGESFESWQLTGDCFPVDDERGTLISHIVAVASRIENSDPKYGQWFDVDKLPEPMVPHHIKIVGCAVQSWKKQKELAELRQKVIELQKENEGLRHSSPFIAGMGGFHVSG